MNSYRDRDKVKALKEQDVPPKTNDCDENYRKSIDRPKKNGPELGRFCASPKAKNNFSKKTAVSHHL